MKLPQRALLSVRPTSPRPNLCETGKSKKPQQLKRNSLAEADRHAVDDVCTKQTVTKPRCEMLHLFEIDN